MEGRKERKKERTKERKKERRKKERKRKKEILYTQPPLEGAWRADIVSGPPEFHPSCCRDGLGRLG